MCAVTCSQANKDAKLTKSRQQKRATRMGSPFFEWGSAGHPMRCWPSSNVRAGFPEFDRKVAFSSFSDERSSASKRKGTLHSLNFRQKKGHLMQVAFLLNGSLAMCYSRMGVEAEFFRNTVPTAGTSQAALGSGNPLCEGFLLSSIARQRLYEKSPVVRLSFFV
jgi:hypothetical protein